MTISVYIDYTNYKGERSWRHIEPIEIGFYVKDIYHGDNSWLLRAMDLDKDVERRFALKDIHEWRTEPPVAASIDPAEREAERDRFYAAYDAFTKNAGIRPPPFDVWLMGRGLMDTTGRALCDEVERAVLAALSSSPQGGYHGHGSDHSGTCAVPLDSTRPAAELVAPQGGAEPTEAQLFALLPGVYYMDPPDGGSTTLLEQLQRMAEDARKWRESPAVAAPQTTFEAWAKANGFGQSMATTWARQGWNAALASQIPKLTPGRQLGRKQLPSLQA